MPDLIDVHVNGHGRGVRNTKEGMTKGPGCERSDVRWSRRWGVQAEDV